MYFKYLEIEITSWLDHLFSIDYYKCRALIYEE